MRDPDATLRFDGDAVFRSLRSPMGSEHFLRSRLARQWVDQDRLVAFEELDPQTIQARRLPFVTQPSEWCDAQLASAGALTLQLLAEAVAQGFDFKDASAWNVIFDGVRPQLCDHTSLVPLRDRRWWAAGQFGRHFILPLLLSARTGLQANQCFAVWRDGVPAQAAARLLGPRRYLSRYWPLMAAGRETPAAPDLAQQACSDNEVMRFRSGLQASLQWMLDGVTVHRQARSSAWSAYVDERGHYTGSSVDQKRQQVASWLAATQPQWVADLGCNNGEFSHLAHEAGAQVVAIDGDHDSVQALYQRAPADSRLYPVVAQLDDLSGGRGWAGKEHPGLAQRLHGRFDVVMMLALLHHLAIAAAVPLNQVAAFAAGLTRRWLILELIGEEDPQLRSLCVQRGRHSAEFTAERQLAAFLAAGFCVESQLDLKPAARQLVLLRRCG